MANINIAKAPANSAILPFYGTAAAFFVLFSILLLGHNDLLIGGYFDFHLLAIVHLSVLGWLTMLIFGAGYQLLPVICERDLHSERLAFVSYLLLLSGIILLASGFWFTPAMKGTFPWWGLMGGAFIFLSSLLFVYNVARTTRLCTAYSIQKTFILTAALWLSATTLAGFLLAWNLRYPYLRKSHLDLLKLHVHMGLAGWFLQLIIGVSAKLIPMFLLGKSAKNYLLRNSYLLINSGLILFLIDGFFWSINDRMLIYFSLVLLGIVFWMAYLRDVYKNRIKRPIDVTLQFSGLSFFNLALTLGCLALLLLWRPASQSQIIYGILVIIGWLSALALGMTFKTLPFIVWNGHYKDLNGRGKIPLPKQLYRSWLVKLQWWLFIAALYGLLIGLFLQLPLLIQAALVCLVATSLSYAANVLLILQHKTNFTHATPPATPNK